MVRQIYTLVSVASLIEALYLEIKKSILYKFKTINYAKALRKVAAINLTSCYPNTLTVGIFVFIFI